MKVHKKNIEIESEKIKKDLKHNKDMLKKLSNETVTDELLEQIINYNELKEKISSEADVQMKKLEERVKNLSKILALAFSISSKSNTENGFFLTALVSCPPSSYPTNPGGAPINF